MKNVRNITFILSVLIFVLVLAGTMVWSMGEKPSRLEKPKVSSELPARINKERGVSISLKPMEFDKGKNIKFDVAIDTHGGSLDFDLTKILILMDDMGNKYNAVKWEGDPPGGHHRYGILTFPALKVKPKQIKVIIRNVYGIKERIFDWEISQK